MTDYPVLPITEVVLVFYASVTGFTVPALMARIRKEIWLEGVEYVRNPSGKIVVNIPAAQAWERKAWHARAESGAPSRQSATPENRKALEQRLDLLNARINSGALG